VLVCGSFVDCSVVVLFCVSLDTGLLVSVDLIQLFLASLYQVSPLESLLTSYTRWIFSIDQFDKSPLGAVYKSDPGFTFTVNKYAFGLYFEVFADLIYWCVPIYKNFLP